MTVLQAPAIAFPATASVSTGAAVALTVTTTGFPTSTVTHTGALLTGMTFTDNGNGTATLAGAAAAGTAGIYPIAVTASNGVGAAAVHNFTLTVSEIQFTSAKTATFIAGQPSAFWVTTSADPAVTSIATVGTPLPAGVTLTNNGDGTATLAGTPAAATGGVYIAWFKVKASNGSAPDAVDDFFINVVEAITRCPTDPICPEADATTPHIAPPTVKSPRAPSP